MVNSYALCEFMSAGEKVGEEERESEDQGVELYFVCPLVGIVVPLPVKVIRIPTDKYLCFVLP